MQLCEYATKSYGPEGAGFVCYPSADQLRVYVPDSQISDPANLMYAIKGLSIFTLVSHWPIHFTQVSYWPTRLL